MTDDGLFPAPPALEPGRPASAAQRMRDRQRVAVEHGQHPLAVALNASIPLHPHAVRAIPAENGPTCGGCAHRRASLTNGNRRWSKCRAGGRVTHGPGTDVRAGWPACLSYLSDTVQDLDAGAGEVPELEREARR